MAFGLFVVLAIAWTWPLAANFTTRIPHDLGDPVLNTWILWWNARAVPFTDAWWNAPMFHPMPGALALSEHLAGIALVTTPLQLAGASALTAYNVAFLLSFVLSGFFAYLLGRELTGSTLAGICGGMAFAFAPYRASQLSHLQVLTAQWMPLMLFGMHRYLRGRNGPGGPHTNNGPWLLLFGGAWVVQALSNGYFLLFLPVLVALWLAWFVDWRRDWRAGAALAGAWIAASLLLVPALLRYRHVQQSLGLMRVRSDMIQFSARPDSIFKATGLLRFWPEAMGDIAEKTLFPGVTAIALIVLAVVLARRAARGETTTRGPLTFYAAAAIAMWAFALGPAAKDSFGSVLARPYTLLTWLPGYNGLRTPARFWMLATLCLATAGAIAFARLESRLPRARRLLAALVFAGLAIDGWIERLPMQPPPGRLPLPDVPNATVLELPIDDPQTGTVALYRAMSHELPLVSGYSGYFPPHYLVMNDALHSGDPSVFTELTRGRPLIIVVNNAQDPERWWRNFVESLPGVMGRGVTNAGSLYILPSSPLTPRPPVGAPLPAAKNTIGDRVILDLGTPQPIRAVQFLLGRYSNQLPKRLVSEVSVDGTNWQLACDCLTGGPAVAGALEDGVEKPVRFYLDDVRARFVRVHPAPEWLRGELTALSPR